MPRRGLVRPSLGIAVREVGMAGGEEERARAGSGDVGRPFGEAVDGSGREAWQPPLPPLRGVVQSMHTDAFAHPAERDFSRLLSYYRIRWVYEPTSFALAWTLDGRPAQMFTPDFYLPDQRLYVELTTMRQRLVTRKNRKLRRLREIYPNVRIKLLYRRDCLRLLDAYACAERPAGACRVGTVLFSEATIRARVAELAATIATDLAVNRSPAAEQSVLALGVGRGSERFLEALRVALIARGVGVETDRVELTRYRTAGGARRVRVRRPPHAELTGRRVLVVEDVVSTGLSLAYLVAWLQRRGIAAAEVCTLLDRRATRLVEVPVRYAGFEAPADLLVGFGLDLRRQFRDLPFIATVVPA